MTTAKHCLKLGTRRSLLAMAQSQQVANQLEERNPGLKVELVGIQTQGDKITEIPLSQIDGKEFFVAELDQALVSKKVDFTVHSLKDLSLERPKEIELAAIPSREDPRDLAIFRSEILDLLANGEEIRIGTSSPRRLENIPPLLERVLPRQSEEQKPPKLEWIEIRGNVHTRLKRIHLQRENARSLDGVILALAGLNRLWRDPGGKAELEALLDEVRFIVLPLSENPTAPGQGALAIECRAEDSDTKKTLHQLHCPATARQVEHERKILLKWGGGCHQRFGASSFIHPDLGQVLVTKGRSFRGERIDGLEWNRPKPPGPFNDPPGLIWDSSEYRSILFETQPFEKEKLPECPKNGAVFVAHSRAWPKAWKPTSDQRIWTSGIKSWERLAKEGIWVEGSAESLGFEFLRPTLHSPVLRLPSDEKWSVITHSGATSDWPQNPVAATYQVKFQKEKLNQKLVEEILKSRYFFWSSASQYDWVNEHLAGVGISDDAFHACGPGKTFQKLKEKNLKRLMAFPSVKEWREWLESSTQNIEDSGKTH